MLNELLRGNTWVLLGEIRLKAEQAGVPEADSNLRIEH